MVCAPALFAEAGPETVFHVARTGNDTNAGDESAPFVSIQRAQQSVREKIAAGLTSNMRVLIHGGTYALPQPLTFDHRDSGTAKFSITYAAVSNETVVVSGGQQITAWRQEDKGLWSVVIPEVSAGNWYFRNLYVNGRRATRARSPNINKSAPWENFYSIKGFDKNTWAMTLGTNQVVAWSNLADVEMVLIGSWSIIRKRVQYANPAISTIILEQPHLGSSGMEEPGVGTAYYLENAHAFLDQPGEWYLDRASGVLSYWPRPGEDMTTAEVIAPRLTALLQIRGTARQPVENLHFDGIRFCFSDDLFPVHGYSGSSHGYWRSDDYKKTKVVGYINPAIHFEFARLCNITGGEVSHIGGDAIHLDKGCSRIFVQGNRIVDIGNRGIIVGNDSFPPLLPLPSLTEQPHSNQVVNNEIADCGAVYHDGVAVLIRPAAQILVAYNSIHDCSHHGISIVTTRAALATGVANGYWIKNNDIQNVCQMLGDSGPIYVFGKQTMNNVISGNVIHDTKAYGAIYFDDDSSGYRVENNVVYNITGRLINFTGCRQESFVVRNNFWESPDGVVHDKQGYALSFSSNRFLEFPHQLTLEPLRPTVTAWVNLTALPSGPDPCAWIVCKNTNELTEGNYSLVVSNNQVGAYLNIGGGQTNCFTTWSSTGPITTNTWYLLAMTYDGTNLNVFCNDQLMGSTVVGRTRVGGKGALRLGKRGDGNNPSFPGLISDVRVYKGALSAAEISSLYSAISNQLPANGVMPDITFHWNADAIYSAMVPIVAAAGPKEPYRSRFREQKSVVNSQKAEPRGRKATDEGEKKIAD